MISPTGSDPRHRAPQAGFTLLELLLVLLILAVVVGMSIPRFRHTFRYLQLQLFASDVARVFTYANRRAVARGETLRIHFDVEGRRFWLLRATEASPGVEFERIAGKLGRGLSVPGAIFLDSRAREVTFYPDGRADPFEMLIIEDQEERYRLVTDAWTGRVKLLESHGK
jgi:prepilin-type N-terminal cleavage/methylation domain-containing protein